MRSVQLTCIVGRIVKKITILYYLLSFVCQRHILFIGETIMYDHKQGQFILIPRSRTDTLRIEKYDNDSDDDDWENTNDPDDHHKNQ